MTAPNYTDEVTRACEVMAVFWVDIHDDRRLAIEHVSLDESLGHCGCSKSECADIEAYLNKYRDHEGNEPLPPNTISPKTTIRELIGHVC